jgi:WD40 repeat protein
VDLVPLQLYASGLIFAPQQSIIRKQYTRSIPKWMKLGPEVEEKWSAVLQTLEGHGSRVNAVAFSPDGSIVASGSHDNTIKLWDVQLGQERVTLKGHRSSVSAVAFSPDGLIVASGSHDDTIKLWDVQLGQEQVTLKGHRSSVSAVAFSLDGSIVASGSYDDTIKLWNVQLGQERVTLTGHRNWVSAVAFSPDGLIVASGSGDNTIKLWDVQSGQEQATLEVYSIVTDLCFSNDGRQLHADRGVLDIPFDTAYSSMTPLLAPCSLSLYMKDQWIVYGTERLLWLPPNFRSGKVAVYQDIVVFGHSSGRMSFFQFDLNSC